ncbi:MAG: hypothetical protein E6R03_13030 [Hyphomicrobiaceae bacterium]|nr:MAG: hypothetical protein E6R03_13030 [Hyphomicrobiaceae bacterium]
MKLGPIQERLFALFNTRPDQDIEIWLLYSVAYEVKPSEHDADNRRMQQRLAPVIARLNGNLPPNNRVEPGQLKRTYRLNTDVRVIH